MRAKRCPLCGEDTTAGFYVSWCLLRHCGCHDYLTCDDCAELARAEKGEFDER